MICNEKVIKAVQNSGLFSNEEKVIALICWLDLEDDFDLDDIIEEGYNFNISGDRYLIQTSIELDYNVDNHNDYLIESAKENMPDHLEEYLNVDAYINDKGVDEYSIYRSCEWQRFEIDEVGYFFNMIVE